LIGVGNLADFLVTCAEHHKAVGETFLIGDSENISTPDLMREIAAGMGTKALLLPFPVAIMRAGAGMIGKGALLNQLIGSLTLGSTKAQTLLGWSAPRDLREGLREAVV
jgi:UDP-glucose 4-epimerase